MLLVLGASRVLAQIHPFQRAHLLQPGNEQYVTLCLHLLDAYLQLGTLTTWYLHFFVLTIPGQVLVAALVCVLFLCIVSACKPYRDAGDDSINTVAYVCLVFTLVLVMALSIQQYEASETAAADAAMFTALLIATNIALVAFSMYQMVMDMWDDANDKAEKSKAAVAKLSSAVKPSRSDNDVALVGQTES